MSIINLGNQEISFQYKEPAQSKEFNKYLRKIIHPGFYDGYTFSKINNSTVAISVGTAWFNVDTDKAVSISITTAVNQTVLEATPILCLSFSWSDTTTNYIDWTWRAIGEATATNEIIVGKVNFSGGIVDGTFDYTNRTVGLIDTTGNIYVSQYIKFGATNNYNLTAESNGLLITKGDSTANLFHFTNSSTGTTVTDGFEVGIDADEQGRIWNYENTDLVIGTNNTTLLVLKNSGIINIPAATETRLIRIGQGRSGDGISYLDLVGDATYTDYGLRILRNGGQNGVSQIIHHGTGDLRIQTNEAADIVFYTTNAIAGRFKANGYFLVSNTTECTGAGTGALQVAGGADFAKHVNMQTNLTVGGYIIGTNRVSSIYSWSAATTKGTVYTNLSNRLPSENTFYRVNGGIYIGGVLCPIIGIIRGSTGPYLNIEYVDPSGLLSVTVTSGDGAAIGNVGAIL